jgi:hypothetical protein
MVSAHRLTLSAAEWALLCQVADMASPKGFGPEEDVPEQELMAAGDGLIGRGVLSDGEHLHPSVAANLAIWAAPAALVLAEAAFGDRGLRAVYVIRGPLGGSLFALTGGGVELSMFPAVAIGGELIRCVPERQPSDLANAGATVLAAFGLGSAPPNGELPLLALADAPLVPAVAADHLALTDAQAALAGQLTAQTSGVLHCLAVSGQGAAADRADSVLVGDVLWLLTGDGWVGVRPKPDGSGRQLVDIVPVRREEIGSWLAPYLARILEGVGA